MESLNPESAAFCTKNGFTMPNFVTLHFYNLTEGAVSLGDLGLSMWLFDPELETQKSQIGKILLILTLGGEIGAPEILFRFLITR